jgi:CPA2 family monovalent cation:H+ antiporter-2
MESEAADLTGIAIVVAAAFVSGLALQRIRQPPIVGYILAGVVLGPAGAGLVARSEEVTTLAELGVVLLLFLIGMELSLRAFVRVLRPAGLTAAGQIAASLAVSFAFGWVLGWTYAQSLLLGFIIAMSSTAVALKILEDLGELHSRIGEITVGVMIAQDIAVVPMLILVDSLGGAAPPGFVVAFRMVIAIAFLAGFIVMLGRRGEITLPFTEMVRGRVDLLTLTALAFAFIAASTTGVLGLSPAYGAFLAGLVIANSTMRTEAIRVTEPIQSVLLVVFFLSIGLLIDTRFIWAHLGSVLLFVIGVIALKTALNVWLLRMVGTPWEQAFPGGLIMAQIGEFSFILAAVGLANGAITAEGYRYAIAVIAISLLVSPFWMRSVRRFHAIAADGVSDIRAALSVVYSSEIAEFERGRSLALRLAASVGPLIRETRNAWRARRAHRSEAAMPAPAVVADPDPPAADPPAAPGEETTQERALPPV